MGTKYSLPFARIIHCHVLHGRHKCTTE